VLHDRRRRRGVNAHIKGRVGRYAVLCTSSTHETPGGLHTAHSVHLASLLYGV
jgi:hypothetical protein